MYKALGTGSQGMGYYGKRPGQEKIEGISIIKKMNILILPEAMFPLIGFWT